MAEPSQKRRPERKPRTSGAKPSMFGKDVRSHLRKAKFRNSRKKIDETEEEKEARIQKHLPPPQPKIHSFSDEENERNEESEEEFLSYVKATVSDDRTYNSKDDCCSGCCKSCGLLSHDLTYLKNDTKSNVRREFEDSKTQKDDTELTITVSNEERTEIDEKNASGDCKNDKTSEIDNLEDELDTLLTMDAPISKIPMLSQVISKSKIKEPMYTFGTVPTKSVDLENWLETVLDV
ncbi:uncharacterized protein LOC122501046 isoform X2 [Leptopilina heterotoma]|uniref:uncharacterized protein LOC122501046 isoform X2 n=1 Tax=Leptopilina heterotoma TaxID=63436 RepID=UPI001CA9D56D|nr:uncharacterized protein LOC122501046 isoform X2 [Leptopilina heterotoma]